MSLEKSKKDVCKAIRNRAGEIQQIGDAIFRHPELGFKEFDTAKLVAKTLEKLTLEYESESVEKQVSQCPTSVYRRI